VKRDAAARWQETMKIQQLPSVTGWRAVSILLVLGCHIAIMPSVPPKVSHLFSTLFDGNLGVRFFFTISGFLITWLMLKEEIKFERVNLKNFYVRRILRIWPVYFSYVALLGVLQAFGIVVQHPFAWRGLLTFTRNIYDKMLETSADGISGHCWSLSIEEQFYLFWPLIFLLLTMRGRIRFLIATILFSIGFKIIDVLGFHDRHSHIMFEEFSTFNYLDCLSWGCLGAIGLTTSRSKLEELFKKYSLVIFPVFFSLILIPYLVGLGQGIQALGFVVLLLHSVVAPDWAFYRILNFKWMNRIGILSYSIYIWQQIIFLMWPRFLGGMWFLGVPVILGVACISYEFLEKPFLALRSKYRN
jgi:peptidoglycan/LPS O-acetylase OafA/YrhL